MTELDGISGRNAPIPGRGLPLPDRPCELRFYGVEGGIQARCEPCKWQSTFTNGHSVEELLIKLPAQHEGRAT